MSTSKEKRIKQLVSSWYNLLLPWFNSSVAHKIVKQVNIRRAKTKVFPSKENTFNAFKQCPLKELKVVVIGQDPYHYTVSGKDVADGMAFSSGVKNHCPKSLDFILQDLDQAFNTFPPLTDTWEDYSLERWAKQGVLLLNSSMTVEKSSPGSHRNIGWDSLIQHTIESLNKFPGIVYILLGKEAKSYEHVILKDSNNAVILKAPHPSVHNYNSYPSLNTDPKWDGKKAFIGNHVFKRANDFLENLGREPIDWIS